LIRIKVRRRRGRQIAIMSRFLFRCPSTGATVAGWQQHGPTASAGPHLLFVAERCAACGGLHIVNPATGRLLADEMPGRVPPTKTSARLAPLP
jgi:hypothetical protein